MAYEIKVLLNSRSPWVSIDMSFCNVILGSSTVNSQEHTLGKTMNSQVCNNRNSPAQTGFLTQPRNPTELKHFKMHSCLYCTTYTYTLITKCKSAIK